MPKTAEELELEEKTKDKIRTILVAHFAEYEGWESIDEAIDELLEVTKQYFGQFLGLVAKALEKKEG